LDFATTGIDNITAKNDDDDVECKKHFVKRKNKSAGFIFAVCGCGKIIDLLECVAKENTLFALIFLLCLYNKLGKLPKCILN